MLSLLVVVSAIFLFVIAPYLTIKKHYSYTKNNLHKHVFWAIVAVLTWPFVPLVMAIHFKDKFLICMFWLSFLVWFVSLIYWLTTNIEAVIKLQNQFLL